MDRDATLKAFRLKEAERAIKRDAAELVFHYPQYDLESAMEMPQGDRKLLLTFVRLRRSEELLEQLSILAAAQSEQGFKKKVNELKGVIQDLTKEL